MGEPEHALMTVVGRGKPPSIAAAAEQLGVSAEDVDAGYGVVPVDPENDLYAVMVRADRLPPADPAAERYRGPFSNPKIEPLRPPEKKAR